MANFFGNASWQGSLFQQLSTLPNANQLYFGTAFQQVVPLISAAIADGLKVAWVVQTATTVTQTYDMQSVTGTGSDATVFTNLRHILAFNVTPYAANQELQVGPKDGSTGLLGPWGTVYAATSYSTAYGPNAANDNLSSPLWLINNGPGWPITASLKDINFNPGSVATAWVAGFIGT